MQTAAVQKVSCRSFTASRAAPRRASVRVMAAAAPKQEQKVTGAGPWQAAPGRGADTGLVHPWRFGSAGPAALRRDRDIRA